MVRRKPELGTRKRRRRNENPYRSGGTGRQGFPVVNVNCSDNSNTAALPLRQQLTVAPAGRDGQKLIAALAELFPRTFVAD
jgi:hypothetical protein